MCGILGVGGNLIQKDHDIFYDLLAVSWLRGHDSTGVYTVTQNGPGKMLKEACSPTYYLANYQKKRMDVLDRFNTRLMMGHTRWATVGAVNHFNAHPFYAGPYVGAHNGTLLEMEFWDKHRTDSEMLFEKMARTRDIVGTLKDLNPSSAFAVSIYEPDTKTFFLSRNTERPLAFAVNKNRPVFYWASELGALQYILGRKGVEFDAYTFPVNKLWKIDLSKEFDFNDVEEFDVKSPHKKIKLVENFDDKAWEDYLDKKYGVNVG